MAKKIMEHFSYLDKGYVKLVKVFGDDELIAEAARASYGEGAHSDEERNRGLINYLMEHWHSSPFELPSITVQMKVPIFVMRQVARTRTARYNEISGRYAKLPTDYYLPPLSRFGKTSKTHKQGTGARFDEQLAQECQDIIRDSSENALVAYSKLIELDLAKELSRLVLPVNIYTVVVWQLDVSNLLKFITLRTHEGAQEETQSVALIFKEILKKYFPMTYEAYDKHVTNSVKLSNDERKVTKLFLKHIEDVYGISLKQFMDDNMSESMSERKKLDLISKLSKKETP